MIKKLLLWIGKFRKVIGGSDLTSAWWSSKTFIISSLP
jgi:hypothetical protein